MRQARWKAWAPAPRCDAALAHKVSVRLHSEQAGFAGRLGAPETGGLASIHPMPGSCGKP